MSINPLTVAQSSHVHDLSQIMIQRVRVNKTVRKPSNINPKLNQRMKSLISGRDSPVPMTGSSDGKPTFVGFPSVGTHNFKKSPQ
jgi:hypothetical protein